MADASRFPNLALPFALAGAAGGWLSAGLAHQPLMWISTSERRIWTAAAAAVLGGATGLLLRYWCVGKRYTYEAEVDPEARLPSDTWARHAPLLLCAGSLAGAVYTCGSGGYLTGPGMLGGALLTLPLLPVCAAVLAAARRAQRARLGSIVAGSDRRAVWGILATTLVIATLEGLPDWPAPRGAPLFGPAPIVGFLGLAGACLLSILVADALALRAAKKALSTTLEERTDGETGHADEQARRIDLGLGQGVRAEVARGGAVYRERDRTLALVKGDPEVTFAALRRAIRRGALGLVALAVVSLAHFAASTDAALSKYEELRCRKGRGESCAAAALFGSGAISLAADEGSANEVISLYEQGCDRSDGASCMLLAEVYRGEMGVERDPALVALFEYRAAQKGICPDGTRLVEGLVQGNENVCVQMDDWRQ